MENLFLNIAIVKNNGAKQTLLGCCHKQIC